MSFGIRYRTTADSFTREFSAVTGQLIRESLKVMPTIRIPQGARISITPLQDIWFKEPKDNQITLTKLAKRGSEEGGEVKK